MFNKSGFEWQTKSLVDVSATDVKITVSEYEGKKLFIMLNLQTRQQFNLNVFYLL